jgi:hypothetical protein
MEKVVRSYEFRTTVITEQSLYKWYNDYILLSTLTAEYTAEHESLSP